jgi:hypothetical protein
MSAREAARFEVQEAVLVFRGKTFVVALFRQHGKFYADDCKERHEFFFDCKSCHQWWKHWKFIRCPLYHSPTTSLYVRSEEGCVQSHPLRLWLISTSALKTRVSGAMRITFPGSLQKRAANVPNGVR